MGKLHSVGVPDMYLDFLGAYLEPRLGYVSIEGVLSDVFQLMDTVFQGTVLGPALWNVFFHDVALAASSKGSSEAMFADDLNAFKKFSLTVSNEDVVADMEKTRVEVHRWGTRNRVVFDPGKEHINIIHPVHAQGPPFKMLGCLVDTKLIMEDAIEQIVRVARPKITALLRTRGMYSAANMIMQYKTHIWGMTEYQNGAIYHASLSALDKLERLQQHYLNELHLTAEVAFLEFNFAPPCLRRDIGMLGFLHKRVLGHSHDAIKQLFPMGRHVQPWHDKQIDNHMYEVTNRQALFHRSAFGAVCTYNRLPQEVVDVDSVSGLQAALIRMAREFCTFNVHE